MKRELFEHSGRCASSRRPVAASWRILAALVVGFMSMGAIADDSQRRNIEPDATVQAAIAQVADADDRAQRQAAFERLATLNETATEELVRQLAHFASRARDTKQAMTAGAVIRRLEVPDEVIARALTPSLESTDAEVAKSVRSILAGLEKRAADRRPDFSLYRGIIADRVRGGEELPIGLIRYMYDTDPGMALLALMRSHQLREPDAIKAILWSEHVVSNVLWKQQYGFLKESEVEPVAVDALSSLAKHEAWWARLYVTETMRKHPAFQQVEVLTALADDANATVRESAAKARSTAPAVQP